MTSNRRRLLMLLVLACGVAAAWLLRERISVESLTGWVVQLGWTAPLVFIACFAIATVFFMPGTLFTLAGGVLFGPLFGTLYNLIGATIGATLAFVTSRYLAQDWVAQRTGKRLRQLVEGVEDEGWRFVALVRLTPFVPFNLLNYALGLTRIRLSHYVMTSFVFMAPSGAAYTYLGYAGRELIGNGGDVVSKALLAIVVVVSVAFVSHVMMYVNHRRRERQERIRQ